MNQPLAYVHPGAKIAKNVVIEPFTTINNNVVIGEGEPYLRSAPLVSAIGQQLGRLPGLVRVVGLKSRLYRPVGTDGLAPAQRRLLLWPVLGRHARPQLQPPPGERGNL